MSSTRFPGAARRIADLVGLVALAVVHHREVPARHHAVIAGPPVGLGAQQFGFDRRRPRTVGSAHRFLFLAVDVRERVQRVRMAGLDRERALIRIDRLVPVPEPVEHRAKDAVHFGGGGRRCGRASHKRQGFFDPVLMETNRAHEMIGRRVVRIRSQHELEKLLRLVETAQPGVLESVGQRSGCI